MLHTFEYMRDSITKCIYGTSGPIRKTFKSCPFFKYSYHGQVNLRQLLNPLEHFEGIYCIPKHWLDILLYISKIIDIKPVFLGAKTPLGSMGWSVYKVD